MRRFDGDGIPGDLYWTMKKTILTETGSGNRFPSSALHLADGEAQVWCASLERPAQVVARFSALLSADEKARADRFYFERDRTHFIIGRGLLRTMLGSYLGMEPARVEFDYGLYGKPALKLPGQTLQFNLAHSKDLAVYAFCRGFQVGIDLEHMREMPNQDAFAEQIFSSSESALIRSLAGEQKQNAFFTVWTCKEAVLKTSGDGLTKPLDQTEIVLAGESARLASIDGDREKAACWRLETFQPAPGYQAALAFERHDCKIVFRQVEDYFSDIS
jgi:4'-phosphopantetheinyl transferase